MHDKANATILSIDQIVELKDIEAIQVDKSWSGEQPCDDQQKSELRSKAQKVAWYARETAANVLGDVCLL